MECSMLSLDSGINKESDLVHNRTSQEEKSVEPSRFALIGFFHLSFDVVWVQRVISLQAWSWDRLDGM